MEGEAKEAFAVLFRQVRPGVLQDTKLPRLLFQAEEQIARRREANSDALGGAIIRNSGVVGTPIARRQTRALLQNQPGLE